MSCGDITQVLETSRFEFHDFYKEKLTVQIKFRDRDRNTGHIGKHRKNLIENIVFTGVSRAQQNFLRMSCLPCVNRQEKPIENVRQTPCVYPLGKTSENILENKVFTEVFPAQQN